MMKPRSILIFFTIFALLLSILGSALTVTPVYAASFIVGDATSLVAAINTANTNNSDDVITLSANITLTAIDNIQNGLPIILTDNGHSLTIEGAGLTISRFAGAPDFRILQIGPGANVTINNLTISGGNNVAGAGIHLQTGSTVILDNVEVSGNNNPTGRGGGIYNYYATLTIQNGSVIGKSGAPNTGCQGGGIFSEGVAPNTAVTILDASTVSYNLSPSCPGGGIFLLSDSNLTIQNGSVVSNNIGGDPDPFPFPDISGGGGIYASASPTITINDSRVSNNTVNCAGNAGCGGGGLKGGSSVTVTNSTFFDNSVTCNTSPACGGAGIYNTAPLTVTNSTFSLNATTNDGGGIYNHNTVIITNSTFSGNTAAYGGGINNQGSLTVTDSTFSDNSVLNEGGGIYNINAVLSTNNTLSSNTAAIVGGGIYNASIITIANNTLSANSAPAAGAGIYNASGATMNYTNTIIANSLSSGGDCISIGSIGTNTNNLVEDGGCFPSLILDPRLGALANNGGFTQTHALLSTPIVSPAIDAGMNCPSTDQRGVSRPQGAGCDIGAYEIDNTYPTVIADSLVASYPSGAGPNNFTVNFSENVYDPVNNSAINDVTNPNNYLVVEDGTNATFNTTSCASGLISDDIQVTITSVTYNAGLFIATVNFSAPVPNGSYRLFVCGTTSITDPALNELNNGLSDYTFDFIVGTTSSTPVTASSLPATGFAPYKITSLPTQPTTSAYNNLGDIWLEIPSQDIKTNIVGVPQTEGKWDVTWLGNDAGWLNGTAFPTWNGNSVITAHVTNADGLSGPFANIKNLEYGDQIIVHLFSEEYIFEVQESRFSGSYATNYAFKSLPDYSYLTLITCQGYNPLTDSYIFRRIVRAVLVEVK